MNLRGMVSMSTLIIGTLVIGSMAFLIIKKIKNVKKGESTCGCGCSGCSSSKACHEIRINNE